MLPRDNSLLEKARLKAMEKAGIPVSSVLADIGHRFRALPPQERTAEMHESAFWAATEKVSADPDIGARLGRLLPPLRGHVIEYFFSSSRTFGGALLRTLGYQKLIHPGLAIRLDITADSCCLVDDSGQHHNRHLVECFVGGAIRFLRDISEGTFKPVRIHFMHAEGASPAEYRLLFDCPVELGQETTRLYFEHAVLGHEIWHADISLQRQHERLADERLEEIDRHQLADTVTRLISQALENGDVSIDTVATRLGLTRRRLQTELSAINTTFNRLLDDYRLQLACQLLDGTDESVEMIVTLTGFSDSSAFYRAFRRWTGMTPVSYRQQFAARF